MPETDIPEEAIEAVAKGIAESGIGRNWPDDFEPLCVSDFDQSDLRDYAKAAIEAYVAHSGRARPLAEWDESMGDVLWWKFPITEPPYVGSPLDLGYPVEVAVRAHGVDKLVRVNIGGWPGYHTHWTPLPALPVALPGQ